MAPIALAALPVALLWVPEARAAGVVSTCDQAHLTTALSGGGTVTFSCNGTITLSSTITISGNTSIDGTGQAVTISGNNAVGIFSVNGVAFSLNNLTISNGNSATFGGGIYNNNGIVTVTNSTFSANSASAGGGIYNYGTLTVTNSTFYGNLAVHGGGIYSIEGSNLTITNSTFSDNSASTGGGIYSDSSGLVANMTITNSTVSGNTAYGGPGGGIFMNSTLISLMRITNSTIYGNSAVGFGGGIFINAGTVTLKSTIIVGSGSAGGACSGTLTDGDYNLASDGTCSFSAFGSANNVSAASLKLGALSSNGGPTQTIALGTGSVAIDAITNGTNGCGTTITTDQRGISRPQHFACDIGAFEVLYKKVRGQVTSE